MRFRTMMMITTVTKRTVRERLSAQLHTKRGVPAAASASPIATIVIIVIILFVVIIVIILSVVIVIIAIIVIINIAQYYQQPSSTYLSMIVFVRIKGRPGLLFFYSMVL